MTHWNEADPVADKRFPNIRAYNPETDDPLWPDENDAEHLCMSRTLEDVERIEGEAD